MKKKSKELDVDFIGGQDPLTKDEEKIISNFIKTQKLSKSKIGNYEKHPFFVKKANKAKVLIKAVGLPKKLAKAK
jgi:hypothetical protein